MNLQTDSSCIYVTNNINVIEELTQKINEEEEKCRNLQSKIKFLNTASSNLCASVTEKQLILSDSSEKYMDMKETFNNIEKSIDAVEELKFNLEKQYHLTKMALLEEEKNYNSVISKYQNMIKQVLEMTVMSPTYKECEMLKLSIKKKEFKLSEQQTEIYKFKKMIKQYSAFKNIHTNKLIIQFVTVLSEIHKMMQNKNDSSTIHIDDKTLRDSIVSLSETAVVCGINDYETNEQTIQLLNYDSKENESNIYNVCMSNEILDTFGNTSQTSEIDCNKMETLVENINDKHESESEIFNTQSFKCEEIPEANCTNGLVFFDTKTEKNSSTNNLHNIMTEKFCPDNSGSSVPDHLVETKDKIIINNLPIVTADGEINRNLKNILLDENILQEAWTKEPYIENNTNSSLDFSKEINSHHSFSDKPKKDGEISVLFKSDVAIGKEIISKNINEEIILIKEDNFSLEQDDPELKKVTDIIMPECHLNGSSLTDSASKLEGGTTDVSEKELLTVKNRIDYLETMHLESPITEETPESNGISKETVTVIVAEEAMNNINDEIKKARPTSWFKGEIVQGEDICRSLVPVVTVDPLSNADSQFVTDGNVSPYSFSVPMESLSRVYNEQLASEGNDELYIGLNYNSEVVVEDTILSTSEAQDLHKQNSFTEMLSYLYSEFQISREIVQEQDVLDLPHSVSSICQKQGNQLNNSSAGFINNINTENFIEESKKYTDDYKFVNPNFETVDFTQCKENDTDVFENSTNLCSADTTGLPYRDLVQHENISDQNSIEENIASAPPLEDSLLTSASHKITTSQLPKNTKYVKYMPKFSFYKNQKYRDFDNRNDEKVEDEHKSSEKYTVTFNRRSKNPTVFKSK